jgi:hypothetical protein
VPVSRAAWVTAKPAEQAMMGALQFNFASPVGMERAVSTAMAYYEQQACSTEGGSPAKSVRLAEIEAQEVDVREQYKSGRLPLAVFKTWLAELTQQREALHQPARRKSKSIKRDEFMSAYCKVVAKRLEVFSERRNVAVARFSIGSG